MLVSANKTPPNPRAPPALFPREPPGGPPPLLAQKNPSRVRGPAPPGGLAKRISKNPPRPRQDGGGGGGAGGAAFLIGGATFLVNFFNAEGGHLA